jgi:CHAD domain-containing protein
MSIEREVKLTAPPTFRMPELAIDGAVEARTEGPSRYQTVYVDTDDLRLARWGCSLRHRQGEGWTLKLPPTHVGLMLVRGEHAFDGDVRHVPEQAVDLVAAYVRGEPLRPVVRLRTVRRRIELRDPTGDPAGEVVDDEISVMDGSRVAARFRELEVEVLATMPDTMVEAIIDRLVGEGASPTDGTPKYLQALGARASAPPEVVVLEVGPDASVEELVRGTIAASVVRLLQHDAGVRLGEDIEDVHQARVATRRLRSDLRTFREVLEAEWDSALRDELGWLGAELGTVRDLDVQLARLRARVAELPEQDQRVGERLVDGVARRREAAREALLASMRSERYGALLDRLVLAADEPAVLPDVASAPAAMVLSTAMERPWKHLRNALDGLPEDAPDADLHLARIRTKRVRYAAEALTPVFGKPAARFARRAAALQEVLGDHQDAVVAQAWLREAATGGARRAFVIGELAMLERHAAAESRAAWLAAWKRLSRKRLRFWR